MSAVFDWAFLLIGIGLIVAALAAKGLRGRPPIKLALKDIINLEMDVVPFLILLGLLASGVGVFFRWRDYEAKLTDLAKVAEQLDNIRAELERFKIYQMDVRLDFHDSIQDTHGDGNLVGELYRKRYSDANFRLSTAELVKADSSNILTAQVTDLNPGDRFYSVVREMGAQGGKKVVARQWKNDPIEVPVAVVDMRIQ